MKRITIFGGSGFIGRHLVRELKDDYRITVLSRNPDKVKGLHDDSVEIVKFDYSDPDLLIPLFEISDIIINLAGVNVGSRWTENTKKAIKNSRLDTDKMIIEAFGVCIDKPEVIIQGSGMGVYGFDPSDEEVTEKSPLGTSGFLTEVGIAHEEILEPLKDKTRLIHLRTGLVLHGKEGSLPKMAASFKMFLGGPMGSGRQWTSWIHIKDEVRAIRFLMENENAAGPFNLTAPYPVRNSEFSVALGKALYRPSWLHTPASFLHLMMKDMADELLLGGLKIVPERLLKKGFRFEFEHIEGALKDLYAEKYIP